jgi:hypothetical protein
MLVSCLPLVGFTNISSPLEVLPITMPSYTSVGGFNVEHAAVLQVPQRKAERFAGCHRDHRAHRALFISPAYGLNSKSATKECPRLWCRAQTGCDSPKARAWALQRYARSFRVQLHVFQHKFAHAEALDNGALELGRRVDSNLFKRLSFFTPLILRGR